MTRYSDQPEIMAIGDSIYQGIRSLSLLPSAVGHSAPALVARALGAPMTVPDLRHPLLFDLEEEVRRGGLLRLIGQIRGSCLDNLANWPLDEPWSEHEAFDNVAVGGAVIGSLSDDTDEASFAQLPGLIARLNAPDAPAAELAGTIGKLWLALSTCYTLNPRHRPQQSRKSALDQVEDRQPRILLINIGSNEGLFQAGFAGDLSEGALANLDRVPMLLRPLADRLRRLSPRTERIVFNNLVRPRSIPNLMPNPTEENNSPDESYHSAYGPRITSTQQGIRGDELQRFDERVTDINAAVEDVLRSAVGDRIAFADLYGAGDAVDGKHFFGRGLSTPPRGRKLNNKPITPLPFGGFFGGLAGLDNMHPTIPGYALIADAVLDALGRPDLRTDKSAAFAADTLLNDFNGFRVLVAQVELSLLATLGVIGGRGIPTRVMA